MTKNSRPARTKSAPRSKPSRSESGAFDMAHLAEVNHANLQAFLDANEAALGAMGAMNQELAAFASRRLRYNIARSEALMKCSQPEELLHEQMDYGRVTLEQYFTEAAKLMTMAAEVTEFCWRPLEARSRSALDEISGR